ncbi:MAG: glycosyltransferase family 4 protein [Candidatus Aminicenantales bacterium]
MKKLHVLVSAFACYPPTTAEADSIDLQLGSGEALLGWNYIQLISRYHRVSVLTDSRNRAGIGKWQKKNPGSDIAFHYVNVPVRTRRWWHNKFLLHLYYYCWQRRALPAARRLHRADPFDVFHHSTFANDWIPSYIGAYLPVPFVWGPFGGGQKYPKGFQHEFSKKARLGEAGRLFSQWMGRHLLGARRRCLKRASAILICNAETMSVIPPRYRGKVEFFALNGIAAEDLLPAAPRPSDNGLLRILTVARMVLVKRIDFAIRAFARFGAAHPGIPAVLEIVGEGPERAKLDKIAAALALGDRVRFVGWMSREAVLERMRNCDIFLFPSLREGGGFVVIEAMACARPVICLDAAGPGFLIHDEWGIKVKPENPEQVVGDLADALGRLAADPGLRERLGRAARRRVEEYHLFDRMGERLQEIYERALSRKEPAVRP